MNAQEGVTYARASDVEEWRCAWSDGRERCGFPGSISHATRGGGPWYCSWHFFSRSGPDAAQGLEASRGYRVGDVIEARPRPVDHLTEIVFEQPPEMLAQAEPGANG